MVSTRSIRRTGCAILILCGIQKVMVRLNAAEEVRQKSRAEDCTNSTTSSSLIFFEDPSARNGFRFVDTTKRVEAEGNQTEYWTAPTSKTKMEYLGDIFLPTNNRMKPARSIVAAQISNDRQTSRVILESINCSVTTQIRLRHGAQGPWSFVALDETGKEKTEGGDEFYFTFTACGNKPDAAAHVLDLGNGTYLLDFVEAPMTDGNCNVTNPSFSSNRVGSLKVHFQYSCDIGAMAPPTKRSWSSNGSTRVSFGLNNLPFPQVRAFSKPATLVNLSTFDHVVAFGDSILRMLVKANIEFDLTSYHRPNISYAVNPNSRLSMETVDYMIHQLQTFHDADLLRETNRALILGSAVWDILDDSSFSSAKNRQLLDHLEACRVLIEYARTRYPQATVIWKLPHSLHPHRLSKACFKDQECQSRARYMSNSRIKALHGAQKTLMTALNVPVLETYETYFLAAHFCAVNDGRHFDPEFNKFVLGMFYDDE